MTTHDHPSTPRPITGLALLLGFALSGCVLAGIEPEEIDIADETGAAETNAGATAGDTGEDASETGATTTGDATGDGDGDGDGDPSSGGCAEFGPIPLVLGDNPIEVLATTNTFAGSCGGLSGPDAIFSYEALTDGVVSVELANPQFDGVIYLVADQCVPLDEWACDPSLVQTAATAGQIIHVIVDSNEVGVGGTATLILTSL